MSALSWFNASFEETIDSAKEEKLSAEPKPQYQIVPSLTYLPRLLEMKLMFTLPTLEPMKEGATTMPSL